MDGVLRIVNDLFVQVQRLATAPPGTVPAQPAGLDPGQRLQAEAARQPQPLQRWLLTMVTQTNVARGGGAKAALAAAAAQQLAPFCRGLEQRFPFNINGEDLPVDDFMRLFGPGGVFDQFFTQNVRQYVDTTQTPWRPMATDGLPPPISAADLMQFQRAAQIRDAFYPSAASLGLRSDLVPRSMDAGATQAILERGSSLLPKGIKIVSGNFSRGEVIRIRNSEGRDIAHGVSRYNSDALRLIAGQHSQQIDAILGYEYGPVAVHRDDMIIR